MLPYSNQSPILEKCFPFFFWNLMKRIIVTELSLVIFIFCILAKLLTQGKTLTGKLEIEIWQILLHSFEIWKQKTPKTTIYFIFYLIFFVNSWNLPRKKKKTTQREPCIEQIGTLTKTKGKQLPKLIMHRVRLG